MRRVRASFLLRCVVLAGICAVFGIVWLLTTSSGWTLPALGLMALTWFVFLESGLLPMLIESLLVRRAQGSSKPVESIWFVDLDLQQDRRLERFHEETEDNPTIR